MKPLGRCQEDDPSQRLATLILTIEKEIGKTYADEDFHD
jgi:hypothetical protein